MNLTPIIVDFFAWITAGKTLEAIERFYDDGAVQIENNDPSIKGKQALLDAERRSLSGVRSFSITVPAYAVNEQTGTVAGSMCIVFETLEGKKKKLEEAFVQEWQMGKLIYQRFYYKAISDVD